MGIENFLLFFADFDTLGWDFFDWVDVGFLFLNFSEVLRFYNYNYLIKISA